MFDGTVWAGRRYLTPSGTTPKVKDARRGNLSLSATTTCRPRRFTACSGRNGATPSGRLGSSRLQDRKRRNGSHILMCLASFTRLLGRYPTQAELRLQSPPIVPSRQSTSSRSAWVVRSNKSSDSGNGVKATWSTAIFSLSCPSAPVTLLRTNQRPSKQVSSTC